MSKIENIQNEIQSMTMKIKDLDSERLRLKSSVDHTELAIKENKISMEKDEQWTINASFSLRDRKRKLKKINLEREALKFEVGRLKKELTKENQRRLDSTWERLFIMNARILLSKEDYEKVRDATIRDMELQE